MSRTKKNAKLVDEIFRPNKETGISEWKTREELEETALKLGYNGLMRHGVCFGVPKFLWDTKRKNDNKNNKIIAIRTIGFDTNLHFSRNINPEIRNHYKGSLCVVCGNKDIVIDHKNDLYNDPRVLNPNTQTIDDFQPLCNSCNLRKRQVCKKSKELGKRYKATLIPMLSIFGIDFIEGDETFDESNPKAMVGTYWYDPKKFMEYINKTISKV